MQARPRRWLAGLAVTAVAAGSAMSAPVLAGTRDAAARYRVSTYDVPVTQPDEYGQRVSLATDVYLPAGHPPRSGWPLVAVFHGGGSDKDNPFDAGHARALAADGYAVVLYSARGHGTSSGQTTIIGPKEVRDLYDVLAWALGRRHVAATPHGAFHLDAGRIALSGYSQGGLHSTLGQVWGNDRNENPYGIHIAMIEPGNTASYIADALMPHDVVKLSIGVALLAIYYGQTHGRAGPQVARWVATAAANPAPLLGPLCDTTGHDTASSPMTADFAWRSPACRTNRLTLPWMWSQAFDDTLFPPDMAIDTWHRVGGRDHFLYLAMGGHVAPAATDAVERDMFDAQVQLLDHVLRGRPLRLPPVVYWTRDPGVHVPASSYAYPATAWTRHTAQQWPPAGTHDTHWQLGVDGRAVGTGAAAGSMPLVPLNEDEADDPVASTVAAMTPLGTSPATGLPRTGAPGLVAQFSTAPFSMTREMDGAPVLHATWTPAGPDSQLVLQVLDRAPDGTLTMLSRAPLGIRGATPGVARRVTLAGNTMSATIRRGHQLVVWLSASDPAFYMPYPDDAPGALTAGPTASLTVPLR